MMSRLDDLKDPRKVAIRDNQTGEIRIHEDEYFSPWMWTDGNFSCDCNRRLFFCRAVGDDEWPDDLGCGDTRFTALYAEAPDGTRTAIDDETNKPPVAMGFWKP